MATVPTVSGEIDAADLGVTLMHEHVFVLTTEHAQNYRERRGATRRSASPTPSPSSTR